MWKFLSENLFNAVETVACAFLEPRYDSDDYVRQKFKGGFIMLMRVLVWRIVR